MAGVSWLRVRVIPRPTQKNRMLFKKNFQQAVQAALTTREPTDERAVLLMAEDEGCFGRPGLNPVEQVWEELREKQLARDDLLRWYRCDLEPGVARHRAEEQIPGHRCRPGATRLFRHR
jgi:hypothetical protein